MHVAIRLMRLLGIISLLLTTCMGMSLFGVRGGGGSRMMSMVPLILLGLLVYGLPGVVLLVLAHYLGHRHFWAVVASLCIASIGFLVLLAGAFGFVVVAVQNEFHPAMFIPVGALLLILIATGWLIVLLARSFESIKHTPPGERGFEPIMAQPLAPPTPSEEGPHDPPRA
jgi:hypothetical protein